MRILCIFATLVSFSLHAQVNHLDSNDLANIKKYLGEQKLATLEERIKFLTSRESMGPYVVQPKGGKDVFDKYLSKLPVLPDGGETATHQNLMLQLSEDAVVYTKNHCQNLSDYKKNKSTCSSVSELVKSLPQKTKWHQSQLNILNNNLSAITYFENERKHKENMQMLLDKSLASVEAQKLAKGYVKPVDKQAELQASAGIFEKCAEDIKNRSDENNLFYKTALRLAEESKNACEVNFDEAIEPTKKATDLATQVDKIIMPDAKVKTQAENEETLLSTVLGIMNEVQTTIEKSMEARTKKYMFDGKKMLDPTDIRIRHIRIAKSMEKDLEDLMTTCQASAKARGAIPNEVDPSGTRFEKKCIEHGMCYYTQSAEKAQREIAAAEAKFDHESIEMQDEQGKPFKIGAADVIGAKIQKIYANPDYSDYFMSAKFRDGLGWDAQEVNETCLKEGEAFNETALKIFKGAKEEMVADFLDESFREVGHELVKTRNKVMSDTHDVIKGKTEVTTTSAGVGAPGYTSVESKPHMHMRILEEYVRDYPLAALKYIMMTPNATGSAYMCTALINEMKDDKFRKNMDYLFLAGGVTIMAAGIILSAGTATPAAVAAGSTMAAGSGMSATGIMITASMAAGGLEASYLIFNRIPEYEKQQLHVRAAGAAKLIEIEDAIKRDDEIGDAIVMDYWGAGLSMAGMGFDFLATDAGKFLLKNAKRMTVGQARTVQKVFRSSGDINQEKLLSHFNQCLGAKNFDICMEGFYQFNKVKRSIASKVDDILSETKATKEELISFRETVVKPESEFNEMFLKVRNIEAGNAEEAEKLLLDIISLKKFNQGLDNKKILQEVQSILTSCTTKAK
ncbi:MAG: interferon alpha-inducible IFI6/IFI27 family protein [Bacteriovoracaceae bacterium]|nr:interferon alpha-inducible IFI6/IFI27 family protein [Bacteriovoracaceae bacterium]